MHEPIFHASTIRGIRNFGVSKHSNGEQLEPSAAIWFRTRIERAAYHIRFPLRGRLKNATGYIYECRLSPDSILVDPNQRFISKELFTLLKLEFPWYKRIFLRKRGWYHYTCYLADKYQGRQVEALFMLLKKFGVDALLNPLTRADGANFNESNYGTTVAVLNTESLAIQKEYSFSDLDRVPKRIG